MTENETLTPEESPLPKKKDHNVLLIALGMLLGLVVLIAFNMK